MKLNTKATKPSQIMTHETMQDWIILLVDDINNLSARLAGLEDAEETRSNAEHLAESVALYRPDPS